MSHSEFDRFAGSYDQDLAKSLAATGENRDFYAVRRIDWTAQCCARLRFEPRRILDYGCGDGRNAPMLSARFKAAHVLGVDVSAASIALARAANYGDRISFLEINEWKPDGTADLAFTNGVFHHVPPAERADCLAAIRRALRTGALLAFWENNPWNPGTRYVMSQCSFDEKAITISPREARRLLVRAGFRIVRADSLFYFPRALRWLRPIEPLFRRIPAGGQYLMLCRNEAD